jgi:hypothetical protein
VEAESQVPQKQDVPVKAIVQQLADDVSVHGWKVRRYSTSQDVDKEEMTLGITLWRSTASGEQQVLHLQPEGGRRKKKAAEETAPAAEAGVEAGEDQ